MNPTTLTVLIGGEIHRYDFPTTTAAEAWEDENMHAIVLSSGPTSITEAA